MFGLLNAPGRAGADTSCRHTRRRAGVLHRRRLLHHVEADDVVHPVAFQPQLLAPLLDQGLLQVGDLGCAQRRQPGSCTQRVQDGRRAGAAFGFGDDRAALRRKKRWESRVSAVNLVCSQSCVPSVARPPDCVSLACAGPQPAGHQVARDRFDVGRTAVVVALQRRGCCAGY